MAYADRGMSKNRVVALVIVAVIHALLGYAFISGLAYRAVKEVNKDLNVFDVTEEPPPPPEEVPPPPPPPDQPPSTPQVVVPPTPSPIRSPVQIEVTTTIPPSSPPTPISLPPSPVPPAPLPPPPPPPPPPAPVVQQPTRLRGSGLAGLFSTDDYPESAIRNEEQGSTGFSLNVGPNGRVTNCEVTSSSGSATLDRTTCRLLTSRARFTPATGTDGRPIADVYRSRFTWRLPDE